MGTKNTIKTLFFVCVKLEMHLNCFLDCFKFFFFFFVGDMDVWRVGSPARVLSSVRLVVKNLGS